MHLKKLDPIRNSVLCRKLNESQELSRDGAILLKRENVDLYEILKVSEANEKPFPFKVGDVVVSNSTGDRIEINPGEIVYLFRNENIMCKVED
jgi:co-chaperonin GroES (HSP10)